MKTVLFISTVSYSNWTSSHVYDGHYSHLGIPLILKAKSFGIHLFCLPPNTTHVLQPLDVGVFGPLKASWRKILKAYKFKTKAANVTKDRFPQLISELWDCCFTPSQLKAAFKATGLSPFDPKAIKSDCLSSSLVQPTSEETSQTTNSEISGPLTQETPIRTDLRAYFVKALKPRDRRGHKQKKEAC